MEYINFVIGSNGNIGQAIIKHELQFPVTTVGIDKLKSKINHKKYIHWINDCTSPESIEKDLKDLYSQKKYKVKNLSLCAVLDSVPDKENKNLYDFGLEKQNFTEINQRVLVNITSQLYMLKIFEPYLHLKSSVCLFSSIYGNRSPDHRIYDNNFIKPIEYTASKASILGITKHFAVTSAFQKKGRCNCIVLGGLANNLQSDSFKRNYIKKVPLGRMANIDDVINAYKFISSEESSYITGTSIFVDGGYSCW